ncbi:DUF6266 family protein [Pedobacter sp. JY14-1]|uniref:DUF6266 family protein n=1 Tax=Pedobacter sp. JY14-1 TaxID=3034151 RepID=UPI0023E2BACB|nr:DUF6266 family protein [Pedobacter sp. JY14-1]
MAKYKSGIIGPLSGKMGNVVAASWRGVAYLRELPGKSGSKGTARQLEQRFKMALVSGWLRPLRDVIWLGFRSHDEAKTPMNACIGYHLVHALKQDAEGVWVIDFEKAVFSRGELLVSYVTGLTAVNGLLMVKWMNGTASVFSAPDDRATFVVYSVARRQFVTFEEVCKRIDGEVALRLPDVFAGETLQVWMYYVARERRAVSTTLYLGTVAVIA